MRLPYRIKIPDFHPMWGLNRGASVDRHNALSTPPLPPYISKGRALSLQDPQGHTHSPWFKSTLLLFLRLLLSTKKRWPAKPFFSFFHKKNRPQRMVYYRFTNTERTVRRTADWWLCEAAHSAPPEAGTVSFPGKGFGFLFPVCARPLRGTAYPR